MGLSVPVAFQYPEEAALLGLAPFGYFLSLGLKKYHSCSPNVALPKKHRNTKIQKIKNIATQKQTNQGNIQWVCMKGGEDKVGCDEVSYLGVPTDRTCRDQPRR